MKATKQIQCDGWRRTGIFQMGGTGRWEQCKNPATVRLTVRQEGKTKTFPACKVCWEEATATKGIEILKAKPLSRLNPV